MSFLSSTPPDSPLSASPENAENLMKAYLAEERERSKREDRGLRARSSHSSVSSCSSTEAPAWRIAGNGSPNRAIPSGATIDNSGVRDEILSPSSYSSGSRRRDVKVRRPTGETMPIDSRAPSRSTGSPQMYRLTPYIRPPANGASLSHSAPNLLVGTHIAGQILARSLPNSSAPSRESSINLPPSLRRMDDEHRRSRSLSSIPPATVSAPRANKGSFYFSPTVSPYPSSDACSFAKSPQPSFLSAPPTTPPVDEEPLPAPVSPASEKGSESEEVEFGEAASSRVGKGSRFSKFGRRNSGSPTFEPPEPKTLVSIPYTSTSKPLISVPYSSTVSLDSKKPVTEYNEEIRGRPRWQREGQRNTVGGIQRTYSGSKKKTKSRSGIHIPMPEYKKKPSFTVPSLPSLAQRKKWAVGDRMSGLFSGRIFNRIEVKEIIDTSVKNYDSMDPSRRYSRARDIDHSVNPGLDMDSSTYASSATNKPLPLPPTPTSQRSSTAPSTPTAPIAPTQPRDNSPVEPERPTAEPEPKMLKAGFDGMRRSFLMDPQSQTEDEDDRSPVIDITNDLAMAVIEEESALPLRNRRLYQNPSLPSIPELLPQVEKGHSRETSPPTGATSVPPIPTRSLSPSGTGVAKPHLTPSSAPDSATTSTIPPPIPPKSASRASYIVARSTPIIPTPTAETVPKSPHTPHIDPLQTTSTTTTIAATVRQQPQSDTSNPDSIASSIAIARGGNYLGGSNSDIVPDDSLVDWFRTYNFDGVGTLVRGPSTHRLLSNTVTTTPPLPPQTHTPPQHPIVVEEPVPPLESDTDIDPDAATSLTSASNRTSSLLQLPSTAGTDADGVSVHEEERVKMGCNFNDGSLGDFLSWEANLLRVVGDGTVEE
jgi:hypothetical protein